MPKNQANARITAIYGNDPLDMAKRLLDAEKAADSIDRDSGVTIKPNLVVARPADGGATTHVEIIAGIIEYLQDNGIKNISIIEGSWLGDNTKRAFKICGYEAVAKRYGVGLHDTKDDSSTPVQTPAGNIRICDKALSAGCIINVPVLKGHCQTRMTCALKNLKGCIPDSEKQRFHRDGLDRLIAGLATGLKPAFTLVDNLCGDLDFEEGGNPVKTDRLFLGRDPFQIDLMGAKLMGFAPRDIGYLRHGAEWGLGTLDAAGLELTELNRPAAAGTPRPSGKVSQLAKNIQSDQACSACYATLIHALKRLTDQGVRPEGICIGQGWKGKTPGGIGVGECCRGAKKYVPGCPPTAADIVKTLGAR